MTQSSPDTVDAEFWAGVLREYAEDLIQEPTAIEREYLRKAADFIDRLSVPAQAGREPVAPIHQEDAYAAWANEYDAQPQTPSSDAERIAGLQYEAGMYKSLYENCQKALAAALALSRPHHRTGD